MSIIVTAIFDECARHFAKENAKYYSTLHRTALGGGYIILNRDEWQQQPDDLAKKALITSRLQSLEGIIERKANS